MAQLVKCLLPKLKDLTSDSQAVRKLGAAAHTHDLSTREAELGGSLRFAGQPLYLILELQLW